MIRHSEIRGNKMDQLVVQGTATVKSAAKQKRLAAAFAEAERIR
jgi:hypothetical protein